ncbi:hypothetical protein BXZ70DRAFT_961687 [Cristinia sonorae]|uniref:Fe2OG dioxygenase domain-containing protein n=1 Tax=Cristinia sonorae TaxID=1940300 RepID=A0A8K0UDU4_9AGAR|nr:hypothetical protein BXZ70DRAFT_961687 [Cristinia sonorae]
MEPPAISPLRAQLNTLNHAINEAVTLPHVSGTLAVSFDDLHLFFKKPEPGGENSDSCHLNFDTATDDNLELLSRSCDAATFGRNNEDVLDESYRKAGKLDASRFSSTIDIHRTGLLQLIGDHLCKNLPPSSTIQAERYKLNVYGKDAFFEPHKDTPRGEHMFGSLVVVFPTPHQGGALIMRDKGKEWTFDSAEAIKKHQGPCIGYIAFYSDVEHEVTPVTSGYRVTLTYNLYSTPSTTSHANLREASLSCLKDAFERVLKDRTFLPKGGYVGFALQRQYPLPRQGKYLSASNRNLKGEDAELMSVALDMSLEPTLYLWYGQTDFDYSNSYSRLDGVLCNFVPRDQPEGESFLALLRQAGGKTVGTTIVQSYNEELDMWYYEDGDDSDYYEYRAVTPDMDVSWVSQLNDNTVAKTPCIVYGNEASLSHEYGRLCMIVKIGAYGKRYGTSVSDVKDSDGISKEDDDDNIEGNDDEGDDDNLEGKEEETESEGDADDALDSL